MKTITGVVETIKKVGKWRSQYTTRGFRLLLSRYEKLMEDKNNIIIHFFIEIKEG